MLKPDSPAGHQRDTSGAASHQWRMRATFLCLIAFFSGCSSLKQHLLTSLVECQRSVGEDKKYVDLSRKELDDLKKNIWVYLPSNTNPYRPTWGAGSTFHLFESSPTDRFLCETERTPPRFPRVWVLQLTDGEWSANHHPGHLCDVVPCKRTR
jgi:hypothetical protein